MRRLFAVVGRERVPLSISWFSIPMHIVWSWYFVIHCGYGIQGTGIAGFITNGTLLAFGLIYSRWVPELNDVLHTPDSSIFTQWTDIYEIAVPMFLQAGSQRWSKEMLVFFIGFLSTESLAVEVLLFNIAQYFLMFCMGFTSLLAIKIGSHLGGGRL